MRCARSRPSSGFERLYVIGTPCSDNTTTERFHEFLALLADEPDDHHLSGVPRRLSCGAALRRRPGAARSRSCSCRSRKLPRDFFPLTCRTCVDYTNVLADITVGYMGGAGRAVAAGAQRARRGAAGAAGRRGRASRRPAAPASGTAPVKGFLANTRARRRRPAAAPHAGLAAADRRLADAAHRPARPGVRPRARRDEGGRDGAAPAATGSRSG